MANIRSRCACALATVALALTGVGALHLVIAQELPPNAYGDTVQTMADNSDEWGEDSSLYAEGDVGIETAGADFGTGPDEGEPETLWTDANLIARGTWGTCPWEIDSGGMLTVYPGVGDDTSSMVHPSWAAYCDLITSARFLSEGETAVIAPKSCAYLFGEYRSSYHEEGEYDIVYSNLVSIDAFGLVVSQVKDMTCMFNGCPSLKTLIDYGWYTPSLTKTSGMFRNCKSLVSLDLSSWDTSKVLRMSAMFSGCTSLASLDVAGWDTSSVTDMSSLFYLCSSLPELDLSGWNTPSVTNMNSMFHGCASLASLDVAEWDTSNVTRMYSMFGRCRSLASLDISQWDTSNVTNMSFMFSDCTSLPTLDLSQWKTPSVTDMGYMFYDCASLPSLDLAGWDTSNVTSMHRMFNGCSSLASLDVSGWDTSSVKEMSSSFSMCSSLQALDLSQWKTPSVTEISYMFYGCASLPSLDLAGWDTSNVTSMYCVFSGCTSLASLDVSGWDTSSVTLMQSVFSDCSSLASLDLTGWDTSKLTRIYGVFSGCTSLASIKVGTGYTKKSADMFPDATAASGQWWSTADSKWYTKEEIVASRFGKADTYRNVECKISISTATIESIPNKTYTGDPIKPKPTVTLDGATLTYGTDYKLTWRNNTDVGKATVTVTGKGAYTGTKKATFRIVERSVSTADIALSTTSYTYSGGKKKPEVTTVIVKGRTLEAVNDYTVSYEDNVGAGTAKAIVTGCGNYKGTATATFTIKPKSIKDAEITLATTSYTYSGGKKQPKVTSVRLGTKELAPETDYTVSYEDNVNAGTATATVTGTGNYKGTTKATFTIKPKSLSAAEVTLSTTSYTYSGGKKQPKVASVKLGTTKLKADTDYTVSYKNNVNAGTATATVTGCGNYKGTAKATFTIKAKSLKGATVSPEKGSCAYTGKALKPPVTVKLGTKDLTEGTDFTVSYKDNVEVGVATVTVKGTGNYTGTATSTFKVVPARPALSKVTPGTGCLKAYWKAASVGGTIDGWQVQRAADSTFKTDAKSYKVADPAATSKKVSGLTSGTTYHVRVRTYKVVGGVTYYSSWSKAMNATAK